MLKRKNKLTAMLLAGTMVLGMTACGGNAEPSKEASRSTESGAQKESSAENAPEKEEAAEKSELADYVNMDGYLPICEEPITITISGGNRNQDVPWDETDQLNFIRDSMGINIEGDGFDADTWKTQFTLMLSDDSLPDLLVGVSTDLSEINKYGAEGYFLPLNEYLDYMPAFKAYLEKYPDYKAVITAPDGNIYGLSKYGYNPIGQVARNFMNKVWLDNVGMDVPTTLDEFYEVLKAFKEKDANGNGDPNDEIPMSNSWDTLRLIMHAFGLLTNSPKYSPLVDENGKVYLGQETENFKEFLKFMNKLYEEGLYDKDALVQTTDEFRAKCSEDKVGFYSCGSAPFVEGKTTIDKDQNWVYVEGLTSEFMNERTCVYDSAASTYARVAVSADTEYPEAICRLIDYLYTDDGMILASCGVMGLNAEMTQTPWGEITVPVNPQPDKYTSPEEYRWKHAIISEGLNVRSFFEGTSYNLITEMDEKELEDQELLDTYGWQVLVEKGRRQLKSVDAFPVLSYTPEEVAERATLNTDVTIYIEQAIGQFITGELDVDADWDTYLTNLKNAGSERLIAIEQAAYDRR